MSKPEPPTPPNPIATAGAQTGTNVSTAIANQQLNAVNQVTPEGTLSYANTGNYTWTDPTSGQVYTVPQQTMTQTLSPAGQAVKGQTDQTKFNLAQMANQQSQRIGGLLGSEMHLGFAPQSGRTDSLIGAPHAQLTYDSGGNVLQSFRDAGPITTSYGPGDFSQDRTNVEAALMARMNPQLMEERSAIENRLADQGIRYGSAAYTAAMDDYNRQANDARFAAVGQAGSEQQRMMDMAAQRAGFENAAQQQNYEQLLGRATFFNQGQAQVNSQNAAAAGFYNSGAAQQLNQYQSIFNAENAKRQQYMQEQYAQRNQPINEITSLMSGSQMQTPSWLNGPNAQIPTTDFAGIMNQNFNQQQQNYQQANQNWQSTMGGLLGLGGKLGSAYMMSDERVKKNIDPMGTVFAAGDNSERKKLPIYEWQYKGDPTATRHVGPMAQDVEKIDRGAVKTIGGIKHINPSRVMGDIMRAA